CELAPFQAPQAKPVLDRIRVHCVKHAAIEHTRSAVAEHITISVKVVRERFEKHRDPRKSIPLVQRPETISSEIHCAGDSPQPKVAISVFCHALDFAKAKAAPPGVYSGWFNTLFIVRMKRDQLKICASPNGTVRRFVNIKYPVVPGSTAVIVRDD